MRKESKRGMKFFRGRLWRDAGAGLGWAGQCDELARSHGGWTGVGGGEMRRGEVGTWKRAEGRGLVVAMRDGWCL